MLLHAHPAIRDALLRAGLVEEWPEAAALRPPSGSLILTGASVHDVTERLAVVAGIGLPGGAAAEGDRVAVLLDGLRRRNGEPLTVFADSLDEARDPVRVAATMRDAAAVAGVRLIVGTRPRPSGGPAPAGRNLLDELGRGRSYVQILEIGRDPAAIREFVTRRLHQVARVPGLQLDSVTYAAGRLATGSAGVSRRQFLGARLAVREIQAAPAVLLPDQLGRLDELLNLDHDQLFANAVARMARECAAVEPFLEALAFSRGRGLPRADLLWVSAAQSLAEPALGRLREQDLDRVLALAGPYIMLDSSDGQSVYRLAHRTFHDYYLARRGAVQRQLLVVRALIAAAGDQAALNPYLRRFLPRHASAAGAAGWAALAARPDVLDRLDIRALCAEVMHHRGGVSLAA